MRAIWRALTSTVGILLIVLVLLSLTLWLVGPFFGTEDWRPLDELEEQLIGIGVLTLITLIAIIIVLATRKKRDRQMTEEIVESAAQPAPAGPNRGVVDKELQQLQQKMKSSLEVLTKKKLGSRGSRKSVYQLPWYIIIGPPGAGKTTAIEASGLEFPLQPGSGEGGKRAIGGVGGTRNCDWWFTNDAVLLDTAGRYTIYENEDSEDAQAWLGFLAMLKKNRPRQPVNGAMVAISLYDLSQQDETTQAAHAAAIRRRLDELREKLGVRFPVYVLFTKADMIAGFNEFFADLGKEARAQVWGFTLPHDPRAPIERPVEVFQSEFDALLENVNDRSLERMEAEADHEKRALICAFPNQLASLRPLAEDFLRTVLAPNVYGQPPFLRGVYFTCGTQKGTPIDRLMQGMAQTFGLGRQALSGVNGEPRSYFLNRLLKDVMFGEAGLVSADDRVERRHRWVVRGAIAAALLVFLGVGALWTYSFIGNRALIDDTYARIDQYNAERAAFSDLVKDADFHLINAPLNLFRDLPSNPLGEDKDPPIELTMGLYQGALIGSGGAAAYRAQLNYLLLPRMMWYLEREIESSMNNEERLYGLLRVYMMVAGLHTADAAVIQNAFEREFAGAYRGIEGSENALLRADLNDHVAALFKGPRVKIDADKLLVERAQEVLRRTRLSQRIFDGILETREAVEARDFQLSRVGGPALEAVFTRTSGALMSDGIDGIFTRNGFHKVFLPKVLEVSKRVQEESWVLGEEYAADQSNEELARLAGEVLGIYYDRYVEEYSDLLDDLVIVPIEGLGHAQSIAQELNSATSPILLSLDAIANELRLSQPPASDLPTPTEDQAQTGSDLSYYLLDPSSRLFLGVVLRVSQSGGRREEKPGEFVEGRFEKLLAHTQVPDGGKSKLQRNLGAIGEFGTKISDVLTGGGDRGQLIGTSTNTGAAGKLRRDTSDAPAPLDRWIATVAAAAAQESTAVLRTDLNDRWREVADFCRRTIEGRYPFVRSREDVALADFQRMFAPGGELERFFQTHLEKYVEKGDRWRWKTVQGVDLGISDAFLRQMQYAAEIRKAFFLNTPSPVARFKLRVANMDEADTTLGRVEVMGKSLTYAHGPEAPLVDMEWPGNEGQTRISLTPQLAGVPNDLTRDGPWSWFRMLDAASLRQQTTRSDQENIFFEIGGRPITLVMRAGSAFNPFRLDAIGRFRCPNTL
ncbi:MAG: type VI secretion system membrane subunit TssM [Pseudomonadota bacterium]